MEERNNVVVAYGSDDEEKEVGVYDPWAPEWANFQFYPSGTIASLDAPLAILARKSDEELLDIVALAHMLKYAREESDPAIGGHHRYVIVQYRLVCRGPSWVRPSRLPLQTLEWLALLDTYLFPELESAKVDALRVIERVLPARAALHRRARPSPPAALHAHDLGAPWRRDGFA
jgi:hypothetical protein